MFGLPENSFRKILEALGSFSEIEKCVIFGSRAIGNQKPGSDVDLAIIGKRVSAKTVIDLSAQLNERLPLPYFFDVVDFSHLNHPDLKEHIKKFGRVFYEKARKLV